MPRCPSRLLSEWLVAAPPQVLRTACWPAPDGTVIDNKHSNIGKVIHVEPDVVGETCPSSHGCRSAGPDATAAVGHGSGARGRSLRTPTPARKTPGSSPPAMAAPAAAGHSRTSPCRPPGPCPTVFASPTDCAIQAFSRSLRQRNYAVTPEDSRRGSAEWTVAKLVLPSRRSASPMSVEKSPPGSLFRDAAR